MRPRATEERFSGTEHSVRGQAEGTGGLWLVGDSPFVAVPQEEVCSAVAGDRSEIWSFPPRPINQIFGMTPVCERMGKDDAIEASELAHHDAKIDELLATPTRQRIKTQADVTPAAADIGRRRRATRGGHGRAPRRLSKESH